MNPALSGAGITNGRKSWVKTEVFNVNSINPEKDKIEKIAKIIKSGGVVAIPTETVFGLCCDATNKEAIDKLYKVKKRSEQKPFTIQIESIDRLLDYVNEIPPGAKSILGKFWPGPLTVIINTKSERKGFRIPDNKCALSIIKEVNSSLAVTSANISGQKSVSTAADVLDLFNGTIEAVVDDGTKASGVASSVVDFTKTPPEILRFGSNADELRKLLI